MTVTAGRPAVETRVLVDPRMRRLYVRRQVALFGLLLPALLLLLILFVYPIARLLVTSVYDQGTFTLEHYQRIVQVDVYLRVMRTTFTIALQVTAICLKIGRAHV